MEKYTILKAEPAKEADSIFRVLERNLEGISRERFEWNYLNALRLNAHCWIAKETSTGAVVGIGSIFPRDIFINSCIITAGIAGDFAVDKAHRAFGPALKLQRTILSELEKNSIRFSYTIPNSLSEQPLLRMGYREIGKYSRFVKVLKTEYKAGKNILPDGLRIGSGIADLGIKLLSKERGYRRPAGVSVETPDRFDAGFDDLWELASGQFHVMGVRTAEFLEWRYQESPYKDYRIFAIKKGKKLAGYIVYYVLDNVAYIADMLCANPTEVVNVILSEFSIQMRSENLGSISVRYFGGEPIETELKKMNFIEDKNNKSKVLIYNNKASPPSDLLLDKENWYIFEGDNDI